MFDIGFLELLMIAVIGLLVMGPERLPGAIRTTALWMGRLRRSFNQIKTDIEREVGADEIRQQLHNEAIMKNLAQAEQQVNDSVNSIKPDLSQLEYDIADIIQGDTSQPKRNSNSNSNSNNDNA
jgi:sec-independent protein translocase protein TatB